MQACMVSAYSSTFLASLPYGSISKMQRNALVCGDMYGPVMSDHALLFKFISTKIGEVVAVIALAQNSCPLPSVASKSPGSPSVFGIVIAPAVTDPLVLTLVTEILPNCTVLLTVTLAS